MKIAKQIIVDLLLAFIVISCILFILKFSPWLKNYLKEYKSMKDYLQYKMERPEAVDSTIESIQKQISMIHNRIAEYSEYIALASLSILACIFIFIYCNPRLFRISTWTNLSEEWAKNKSERIARKSAKAEADKQKRIEELQAELDELKDKTNE